MAGGARSLLHSSLPVHLFFPLYPSLPPPTLSSSLFLSVTTALEEMSFHGRFAAISKMAALPNG